jgi:hypothetical protein
MLLAKPSAILRDLLSGHLDDAGGMDLLLAVFDLGQTFSVPPAMP